ncbi:hypothetical protein [Vibrio splendidus]|uniref:hypothetical protein n=1 Tax=Vibrio splendidus TaxID=29497 RepID=UPI00076AC9C2|nr:hypothetical protein [Vibrio splendidus]
MTTQLTITNLLVEFLLDNVLSEKKLTEYTPSKISDYKITKQGINKYNAKHRITLAQLIAECLTNQRQHFNNKTYYYLGTTAELKIKIPKVSGQDGFTYWNRLLGIFTLKYQGHTGQPNGYQFDPFFEYKLQQALLTSKDYSFQSLYHFQAPSPHEHDLVTYITPDIQKMNDVINDPSVDIKYKVYLYGFIEFSKQMNHHVPQYYRSRSTRSDRLCTFGCYGLQNQKKLVKNAILNQYTEYDMNACAYAILLGLTPNPSLYPHLTQYMQDTTNYRAQIAQNTGSSIKDVKRTFLMLSFGSPLSQKFGAGRTIANLDAIKANQMYLNFVNDYKKIKSSHISNPLFPRKLKEIEKEEREKVKGTNKRVGDFKSKYMVWLYNHFEVQAVQAMQSITSNPNDCFLHHDAIYTKNQKPSSDFELAIKDAINIKINVN